MSEHEKPVCKLVGEDGNAFVIVGKASAALRRAGLGHLVAEYQQKAMAGDCNDLLAVTMEYVEVE